jgi:predicted peptidase
VAKHGLPKLIKKGEHYPFILIAPQCPDDGGFGRGKEFWWMPNTVDKVKMILDAEKKRLRRVDNDRVYLTGLSMGGMGSYLLCSRFPSTFAAVAPVCGRASGRLNYKSIAHIPFWAFHGDKDKVVRLSDHKRTVDALKAAGAKVKFTVYPGVGHDSWNKAYNTKELYTWMLAQKRKKR